MHIYSSQSHGESPGRKLNLYATQQCVHLSHANCHSAPVMTGQKATPAGWSNRLARESCLSDKHHIRSPRFQCAFITIIRMSANSVVHCQITKISICILNYLSNADATTLAATAILDLWSTQSWFSKSYVQEKRRAINSQSLTCTVVTMLSIVWAVHLISWSSKTPGDDFPYQLDSNQNRFPDADLALTSATIADAREVFEIVIEIQLMVLYAMKNLL